MTEEEYIPIEAGTMYGMRGLRPIELEGKPLPDYYQYLLPWMTWGTGSDTFDTGTFNGMNYKWMQRKRDNKIVAICKAGHVFEVL